MLKDELHRRYQEAEKQSPVRDESSLEEPQELPFYVHSTDTVYKFLSSITQPLARLYQEVVSIADSGQLGLDHQKLACILFTLHKATCSAVNIRKMDLLWK